MCFIIKNKSYKSVFMYKHTEIGKHERVIIRPDGHALLSRHHCGTHMGIFDGVVSPAEWWASSWAAP